MFTIAMTIFLIAPMTAKADCCYGKQYDKMSGLYYLRARCYDTNIGRFTQEDSLGAGFGRINIPNTTTVTVNYNGVQSPVYRVETIPAGVSILQRGSLSEHYEIIPAYPMTLNQYQTYLNQITVTGPY